MTEFAYCPGYQFGDSLERPGCLSLVKVWPGDQLNYCCRECFETSWRPIEDGLWGRDPVFVDNGHSGQCKLRQHNRIGEVAVYDREFKIMGKVPDASTDVPPVQ